jgi:hypothetical protein
MNIDAASAAGARRARSCGGAVVAELAALDVGRVAQEHDMPR